VSSQPDPGDGPRPRPTTRAQITLEALKRLPRVVWLLGLASLLNDVSSEAIFPLLPGFLVSLGAPMSFLGLIEGSADALASFIKMAAGRLSDRGPRRAMVASGYAMPALARGVIAVALAPWQVLGARLFDRAGKGIRSGPRDALIADSVAPSQRGRAFGLNRSMDHLGAAVGPAMAAGMLALGASLRTTFAVAALIGALAPLLLFYRLRDDQMAIDRSGPVDTRASGGSLRHGFSAYMVACVIFALGNSSDAFLLIRAGQVGWRPTTLPLLWTFHHLVKSMAALPGGALSDRHSRALVVAAGWVAYALVYIGFGVATAKWQILGLFMAYALYHGLAEGAERAIVADLADRGARGRAFGLYHGITGAAALPAGLGTGWIWDRWGAAWALSINAIFAAVAGIGLLVISFAGPLRRQV
jgi:MFS family permease